MILGKFLWGSGNGYPALEGLHRLAKKQSSKGNMRSAAT